MTKKLSGIFTVLLTIVFCVQGEVLFEDDFSDVVHSHKSWQKSNPEFLELSFTNGTLKLENTSDEGANFAYYELGEENETFTYSVKISFDKGQFAGIAFCMSSGWVIYSLLISPEGNYQYGKIGDQNPVLFSSYIDPSTNIVTVSKKGSEANIFINEHYIATMEVPQSSDNHVGFLLTQSSSAIYDDVKITDEFLIGSKPSTFEDDFEDGVLAGWSGNLYMSDGAILEEKNGKLFINTTDVDSSYANSIRTDIDPGDNFVLRVEVSHKGGIASNVYGLSLWGEKIEQRITFCITADRRYTVMDGYDGEYKTTSSTAILGEALVIDNDTYYFVDTLEVVKSKGSDHLCFVINKDTVTKVDNVAYDIVQAGIELSKNLELEFDNFSIKELSPVSVAWKRRNVNRPKAVKNSNTAIFDILGRSAGQRFNYLNRQLMTSPGLYISKDQKSKIILKK